MVGRGDINVISSQFKTKGIHRGKKIAHFMIYTRLYATFNHFFYFAHFVFVSITQTQILIENHMHSSASYQLTIFTPLKSGRCVSVSHRFTNKKYAEELESFVTKMLIKSHYNYKKYSTLSNIN